MRDAAALIILQMDKSTGISELRNASASASSDSAPENAVPDEDNVQTTAAEDIPDDTG
jgi:hypothetical protein